MRGVRQSPCLVMMFIAYPVMLLDAIQLQGILANVWPAMRFKSHAERTAGIKRTMQDPKPFVAQSFDLAMGVITVKFPFAKLLIED